MEVFELFEALQTFAKDNPVGADKILLEVAIEHKGEVLRVPIPRSAAATFDSVAGITGVQVEAIFIPRCS